MKKNIKYLIFSFLLMGFIFVNAATIEPRVKTTPFGNPQDIEMSVDDGFDFSLISFEDSNGTHVIPGSDNLKKIYSGDLMGTYFTAYCLDGNLKYPEYEVLYNAQIGNIDTAKELIKTMTVFKVLDLCGQNDNCTMFNERQAESYITNFVDDSLDEVVNAFMAGEEVTTTFSKVGYTKKDTTLPIDERVVTYDATQVCDELGLVCNAGKTSVTFKATDFQKNHYYLMNMPSELGYKKALWIIEHSYPTLSLLDAFSYAGVSYNNLINTLLTDVGNDIYSGCDWTNPNSVVCNASKYGIDGDIIDEQAGGCSEATVKTAIRTVLVANDQFHMKRIINDFVYGTVQYSIWNAVGEYFHIEGSDKLMLGNKLNGNDELNKLYQFLIKDRAEYANYDNVTFSASLNFIKPEKEAYKSTTEADYYGPYTITSNMLLTIWDEVGVVVTNPTSGVTLVDSDFVEIPSTVLSGLTGEEAGLNGLKQYQLTGVIGENGKGSATFYIKVAKVAKATTKISFRITADGFVYANPNDRGILLHSKSNLDQITGISSSITEVTAKTYYDLALNAKTGDTTIASVLIALLISFGLGYFALKFKNNSLKEI